VKDTLAVLSYLLICVILLLSAGFMIWQIVEYAHPDRRPQLWGSHAPKGQMSRVWSGGVETTSPREARPTSAAADPLWAGAT